MDSDTNKRWVTELITIVGSWDSIPLWTLKNYIEHISELIVPEDGRNQGIDSRLSLSFTWESSLGYYSSAFLHCPCTSWAASHSFGGIPGTAKQRGILSSDLKCVLRTLTKSVELSTRGVLIPGGPRRCSAVSYTASDQPHFTDAETETQVRNVKLGSLGLSLNVKRNNIFFCQRHISAHLS